ncbi:transcriptional regulator [[Phormidium ambiguum] IAM M-71]|uniref:Transcriptional regulator n=1 Tax=[Phormidium ambiguum] IAM M-71 TaxID=454136 RepID=A0A1U7I8H8_9CYAN|nr:response regulator [Phormidium ambiguum]OKH32758.1 transcriptional regulator [Phormidium ambiguum IAM M-71]
MKILLVEDDSLTSSALAETLTTHHYTVNVAADGLVAQQLALEYEYDLILLDIVIPKLDGISVCKQLRAKGYHNPILLLTAKDSSNDRVIGLDAGADDYVVKPFDSEELMARIRALLRRGKSISSSLITWENVYFDAVNNEVRCGQTLLHLTPKEYCLLELFLLNPKQIFSRRAILDRLWDFAEAPGEETVSTHIKCLRQKLKAAGATDIIETVHGLGYRLRSPSSQPETNTTHKLEIPEPEINADYHQRVEAATSKVWEKFQGKMLEQIAILGEAAAALTSGDLTPELQQKAKQEAHKLAGSLGIFGFMEGSTLAKELEDLLHLDCSELDTKQVKRISELAAAIYREVQPKSISNAPSTTNNYSPLILIVDDDLVLTETLRIEAIAWRFRVKIATDLTVARKLISQTPPDVVILDLNFPSPKEDGITLLEEITQRVPPIPAIALTGRESLSDRLAVARLGACAFLHKPLPAEQILKVVSEVLEQHQKTAKNRIMIVDDDRVALAHLSTLLKTWGVEVTTLENPQNFWQIFTACIPDLLILDMEMPGFNGVELCQIVRNDPQWQHLPILFVSSHTGKAQIEQAFAAGADDYINKSVVATEIATRIIHRLKRNSS